MEQIQEVEWRQLTLGHLSRNKFWGEDPDTQYHSVVASSTLLRDGGVNILVDPTLPVGEMESRLRRFCGLGREDIDIVFATHFHTDHRVDAEQYPNAKLYMSEASVREVAELKKAGGPLAQIFLNGAVFDFTPAPRLLTPHIEVCPLPGHTEGLAGLLFTSGGKRVLLAGDTIMNTEYYLAREGYFIDASQEKTAASMDWARENADIIVPGHGDWFFAADGQRALVWRRLNLCAGGEEAAVLVQIGRENILINPVLPGHVLREALFDARGLDPADITRVICLSRDAAHTRDIAIMKNARFYLPAWMPDAPPESAKTQDGGMPAARPLDFSAWEAADGLPVDIVDIGGRPVCVFESGGRKIAAASASLDEQALREMGVSAAIMGGAARAL